MKTLYNYLILVLLVIINTSCLKAGLGELETFDQNDITNVRFEYRWWEEANKRMRVIEMEVDKTIDNEKKEIYCSIRVPEANANFTATIREQVSLQTLAMNKEFTYKVVAGNGNEANWTIIISDFSK